VHVREQLRIAGIVITIESNDLQWDYEPRSAYGAFRVHDDAEDACISVHWHPYGSKHLGRQAMSVRHEASQSSWDYRLYADRRGTWILEIGALGSREFVRRVAVFSPDFHRGDVYVELARSLKVGPNPLSSPLDRILLADLVARREGMMLHACAVARDGQGHVFVGQSGSGKTTLAGLWAEVERATVLSDECVVLRPHGPKFWVYGTPWSGEARFSSPQGVPVAGIHFIHHAGENRLTTVPMGGAVERLLGRSLLPTYDLGATQRTLDFCMDLTAHTPLFDFGFVPDSSAVELF
jgi:hypothetical protein